MLHKDRLLFSSAIIRCWLTLLLLAFASGLMAQTDDSAPPKETDGSYVITTAAQLEAFAKIVNDGVPDAVARLDADIDLDELSSQYFTPIGKDDASAFTGTFDGGGHTISNLKISPVNRYGGLFGVISGSAVVKDIYIDKVTAAITTSSQVIVGGICGKMMSNGNGSPKIQRCQVANADIDGYTNIGGKKQSNLGGICGYMVAKQLPGNTISECTFKGNVVGNYMCGGIVGFLDGYFNTVSQCSVYTGSSIKGKTGFGGIAGQVYGISKMSIKQCTVESGCSISHVDNNGASRYGTIYGYEEQPKEMPTVDGYLCIYTAEHLKAFASYVNEMHQSGINARLMYDIDLSELTDKYWTPIGDGTQYNTALGQTAGGYNQFSGTFDGNGYTIRNIKIRPDKGSGLFGYLNSATIKNLTIDSVSIDKCSKGVEYVGSLAGMAVSSNISGCTVSHAVITGQTDKNHNFWGGIVGSMVYGTMSECKTLDSQITASASVGGIVGVVGGESQPSKISQCSISGTSVSGDDKVGGIAGSMYVNMGEDPAVADCDVSADCIINGTTHSGQIYGYEQLPDEPVLVDGYYEIFTATQLQKFAEKVNASPNDKINGRLMRDIDLAELGNTAWTPIGMSNTLYGGFKGIFDGNRHTVRNLILPDQMYSGFFGLVYGTVKDLTLDGVTSKASKAVDMGALCGIALRGGAVISNCHAKNAAITSKNLISYAGGLIGGVTGVSEGTNGVTITGCTFQGSVSNSSHSGGIVGFIQGYAVDVRNCTVLSGSSISGNSDSGGICGYTSTHPDVCISNCVVASDCSVASGNRIYGKYEPLGGTPHIIDGVYQIACLQDLKWFRDYANDEDRSANARLVADIDMLNEEFNPIGDYGHNSSKIYRGTFDGNGHTLSNFHLKKKSECSGLVGYANGAVIKNVNINHVITPHSPNYDYEGAILGFGTNHTYVINCHVTDADIYYNVDCQGDYHGGIAGKVDVGSHIEGCTFQGKVGGDDRVGGIVGEVNSGSTIKGCIVKTGSIIYARNYMGGVAGAVYDTQTKVIECFAQPGVTLKEYSSAKYKDNIAGYIECSPVNDSDPVRGLYYHMTGGTTTSDNGKTTCYDTEVVRDVSGYSSGDYEVCTDMGITYSYFNKRICAGTFDNSNNLKTFSFIDYNHNTGAQRAYRWIDMSIADKAFQNCFGFEKLNMRYRMGGKDGFHVMLDPTDVYPEGAHAFDGCDKLKIYVDPEKYDAFINDSRWGQYRDRIVSTTEMRKAEHTEKGIQYARDNRKNSTGDYQTVTGTGGKTVYCVHVIGSDSLTDQDGVAKIYNDIGVTYAYRTTKIWAESFRGKNELRTVRFLGALSGTVYTPMQMTIGSRAFADCPNLQTIDVVYGNTNSNKYEPLQPTDVYPVDDTMLKGNAYTQIRVWPDLVDAFKADPHWAPYADRIVPWTQGGCEYREDGVVYQSYSTDDSGSKLDDTWLVNTASGHNDKLQTYLNRTKSDFVSFDSKKFVYTGSSNVYYLHVAGVDNEYLTSHNGKVCLYNDIGSYYNYRTVSIDATAFRGNNNLRYINFGDVNHNSATTDVSMQIAIQKGAFAGCSNLEYIDLVYYKYTGVNRVLYLDPTQVVPAKGIFDADAKTKIRVNPDKVAEFKADPNWAQYADRIIAYEASDGTLHYEDGVTYMESGMVYDSPDGVRCFETYVTGVSDNDRRDFTIYNDIGETYAYRNVLIKSSAFTQNNKLNSISFSDAVGGSAHNWINMRIADNAFDQCYQFKAMYMSYLATAGIEKDHTIMLDPEDVRPEGKYPFTDCPQLKIYVDAEKYDAFVKDSLWGRYANQIVATTDMRHCDFAEEGALYARDNNKDGTASYKTESGEGDKTVYLVHVNGPDDNLLSKYKGEAVIFNDPGTSSAYRTTKVWAEAYTGCTDLRMVRFKGAHKGHTYTPFNLTIGHRAFADCPNLQYIDVVYGNTNTSKYEAITPTQVYPVDSTMMQGNSHALIRVWPDLVDDFKADPHWAPYADRIIAWSSNGKIYSGEDGLVYTSYTNGSDDLSCTELCSTVSGHDEKLKAYLEEHKSEFADSKSINFDEFLCGSKYGNVYYTRATALEDSYLKRNRGRVTLYNDIGSYYNYRTVAIDCNAFRGNQNLRRLDFGDISYAGKTYVPLKLMIEKGAFKGCTNLEKLDLIYRQYTGTNTIVYIDPTQVIPAKDLFDKDSKVQIRVGADKIEAFKADPNWAQYADRIIAYEASFDEYDVEGLTYTVTVDKSNNRNVIYGDNNQDMYETKVTDCENKSDLTDYVVYTDIGTSRDYFTTTIQNGAFSGEKSLCSLRFADTSEAGAVQAYKWIDMKIEDNAFLNCPNFKSLYMRYTMYAGWDHVVMLGPDDVYPIGLDAFSGCDSLRIYVDAEKYNEFVNNEHWRPYADRIVSTTSMRWAEHTYEGVAYTRVNNKDGRGSYGIEHPSNSSKDVYQLEVMGPDLEKLIKNHGVAKIYNDIGQDNAYRTKRILAQAFAGCKDLTSVRLHGARRGYVYTPMSITIGSRAFADCPGLHSVDLVYGDTNDDEYKPLEPTDVIPDDETILDGSPYAKIRVWPSLVQKFKTDPHWSAYANRIVAWEPVGREYTGENGLVYQGFLSESRKNKLDLDDLCSSTDGHNETLKNYLKTSANDYVSIDYDKFIEGTGGSNVYYIRVSATEANWMREHGGKVTIYNDIGSAYDYRTVYIDSTAFRGNNVVTSIDFGDNPTDVGKTDLPLRIMIAKNSFKGCTRLRSINMVYHKYTGSNTITYLDPDQVIPPKEMFDNTGNRKVAICVAPDKVNAFKADPNWKQYADQIVAYTESYDDFTEDGVVYGYMPVLRGGLSDDYYSNRYNEEFRNDYAALHGNNYGEFEWPDILTADDYYDKSARVWYMQIKGVDNDAIRDNNGHLTLYNDIGSTYSYKTIAVAPNAFAGNDNIVSVSFSDQCSAFATCHDSEWGIILPDGVFKDCKNLKHIDMVEYVTLGVPNHYAALSPKQIIIGDHAFDGCPDDFEIRVPAEMYDEFVNDPNWSRYRKHIAIFEFTPTETDGFNVDGVEYDYAAHLLNNMPTEQRAYMSWSLANIPVQLFKAVIVAALSAGTGGGFAALFAGTSITAGITSGVVTNLIPNIVTNVVSQTASIILAEMGAGYAATLALGAIMGLTSGAYQGMMGMYLKGISAGIMQGLKSVGISYAITGVTTGAGKIYSDLSGSSDAILATTDNDPSADIMGTLGGVSKAGFMDFFNGTHKTSAIESIYHMYIKGVDNSKLKDNGGVMNIYNDPGSYYHYRTVGMDSKALQGNKEIRHIKFTDSNGVGTNVQSTFQMTVPDSAFMDCSNLERLDMFMLCTEGTNNTQALGPENFCLCGNDVFKNCDKLKVYVAPNKYDEFKNDSIWGKLNLVIDYEYEEPTTGNYWGVYYGNNYKLNSKWDYMTQNDRTFYNIHVVKPDNEYLKSNDGQATIVTDYGVTYNYNTTYVGRKAFYANKLIKSVMFKDTYDKNATCYILPAYELRDSAFAMCPNMEAIYMIYSKDGKRLMPLTPSQVSLGSGVFSGSPKLKIKVIYDNWADYLVNSSWSKYENQISPVLTYFSDNAVADIFADDEVKVKGYGDTQGNKVYEARLDDIKDGVAYNNKFDRLKGNTSVKSFDELKTWGTLGLDRVFDNMFYGCSNLCSIILPYSIKSIGEEAFAGCRSLETISIPDSVASIGSGAFSASGVKAFYFRSEVPAQLGTNPFLGCPVDYIIYVPTNSVAKYKEQWPEYADHIMSVGTRKTYYKVDMANYEGTLALKLGLRLNSDDIASRSVDIGTLMGDVSRIDSLEITGNINTCDLATIGCLANRGLQYLDLSKANFTGNDALYFKWLRESASISSDKSKGGIFARLRTINTIVMPETGISYTTLSNGSGYETSVFNESPNLSTVVFHRSPSDMESAFSYSGLKNIVSLSDDYIDFEDALDDFVGSVDLYCTNTANSKYTANSNHKKLFGHVYSPFKDDEVFRILAKKGYFNFQKLGGLSNTKDWFTGTDIKSFDEMYVAMSDSILANRCFADCRKLETIALPITLAYIDNTAFEGCSSLRTVKVLGDKPAKLESENVFDDLPDDYRIKVLPSCIDDYRRAWPEKIVRHIMSFDEDADIQTITMDQPGTLAEKLGLELSSSQMVVLSGNFDSYKKLKIVGPINPVDINTLAILAGQSRKMDKGSTEKDQWKKAKDKGLDTDEYFNIGTDIVSDYSPASSSLKFLDLSDASFVNLDGNARPDFVLPRRMFQNCDVLETIVLPRTMKKLTVDALSYSDHLKHVVLGDSTTVIEKNALTNCPRLKSVTSMRGDLNLSGGDLLNGDNNTSPFYDKYTLDTLYCAKDDHLSLASNSYVQKYCKNVVEAYRDKGLMTLMVTKEALNEDEMYKVKSFDDMFRSNSNICDLRALSNCVRVKNVDDKAFANMPHLKRIALPSGIETLGQQLFVGSDSLQYVDWHTGQSGILANIDRSDEASPLYGMPRRTLVYAPVAVNDEDENIVSTQGGGNWYAPRFWRDEQQAVEIPFAFSTGHAEISRTFKTGVKSTIYLPYAIDESSAAALGQFYEFAGYNSGTGEVSFRRVLKTEACKGYLFLPANANMAVDATGDTPITVCRTDSGVVNTAKDGMYGTWERKTWTTTRGDDYGYAAATQGDVTEGTFVRIGAGSWLPPMRSWLRLNPNGGVMPQRLAVLIDNGETTGVIGIDSDGVPTSQPSIVNVYTTDGKMVRHNVDATNCLKDLPKGIYVVNGKKVYCE